MTTRSRYFYVIYLLAGLLITLTSIASLSSSGDRTPMGHIVQITLGVAMVALGGYGCLYPDKVNSPAITLLGAVIGFVLTCVLLFFLVHFYSSTGFFSTGDSMTGVGATAFLLIVSVFFLFYHRFQRGKRLR